MCTAAISARIPQLVFGPYTPFPAEFRIMGPDPANLSEISQKAPEIRQSMLHVRQTNRDWRNRAPALRFVPDQQRLNWVGLSPAEAAQQLQFLITGISVTEVRENTRNLTILARNAGDNRLNDCHAIAS